MSEMIERVREAWRHAERFGRDPAEAAIRAMREPTTPMIDEALLADGRWSINMIPRIKIAWGAMIDAALSPPPPSGDGGK